MILQSQPTIPYEIHQPVSSLGCGLAQACEHKVRYEKKSTFPIKESRSDKADMLPKDTRPPISSKVTIDFAVQEWFQIMLVHMNNPHTTSTKVLEPMRAF